MKTVFHLMNSADYAGAENVVTNIALLVDGYKHIYVSPSGQIDSILEQLGIEHIIVPTLSIKSVKEVVTKYEPDIVHAHDFRASLYASLCAKRIHGYGGKIISHLHSNDPAMKVLSLRSFIYKLCVPNIDSIIVVSQSVVEEYFYKNIIYSKTIVLGNIVNKKRVLENAHKFKVPSVDISYVARLSEVKNPIRFVEIINILKKTNINISSYMVGDDQGLEGDIKKRIAELGLMNNIKMIGFAKNPYPYILASKVGVLTSKFEGFGLSALETLVLQRPVVTTPVGGLVNLIDDSVGKLSTDDGEFSKEISRLLNDKIYYESKIRNIDNKLNKVNNISGFVMKIKKIYN